MGFSPGVAARLRLQNGHRVFLKAVGPEPNPVSPSIHRRESNIVAGLPTEVPSPRFLWSYDEQGWVVLLFDDIEGKHPSQPWRIDELNRVISSLIHLGDILTPSPLTATEVGSVGDHLSRSWLGWQRLKDAWSENISRLDAWSAQHINALVDLEMHAATAVEGNTLLHMDVRADNVLLTPEQVWFVDWPHARVGAAWLDILFFAPSVTMQGGPPPQEVIAQHPACAKADPTAITAAIAAIAGVFTYGALQPAPPGLPTLRAFQAAQGVVARRWLAEHTGWK